MDETNKEVNEKEKQKGYKDLSLKDFLLTRNFKVKKHRKLWSLEEIKKELGL